MEVEAMCLSFTRNVSAIVDKKVGHEAEGPALQGKIADGKAGDDVVEACTQDLSTLKRAPCI